LATTDRTDLPQQRPRPHPLTWLGRHEWFGLLLLAVVAAGVWGFAELADEVVEGRTQSFDERVLLALRNPTDRSDPLGPKWLEEMGRDFTAVGGIVVLTIVTLTVSGYLALQGKHRVMVFLLASVIGGVVLSGVLKSSFDRPRPDLVPHLSHVSTSSFPSGHSMMSAVTYLTLGAILARVQPRPVLKAYVLLLAMLLTLAVGVSRVYVGVHWPTDVLAGWTAGATWALLCGLTARWLEHRDDSAGSCRSGSAGE
jgi:undecaprenyl-diphosphatase